MQWITSKQVVLLSVFFKVYYGFFPCRNTFFLSFNTTLIINIYHSIINITDSFCLVQGIFQPSIPLTHTDAKHNYVSIIHINHIFHQCYLTNKTSVPQEKQLSPLRKKQRVENLERKKKTPPQCLFMVYKQKMP